MFRDSITIYPDFPEEIDAAELPLELKESAKELLKMVEHCDDGQFMDCPGGRFIIDRVRNAVYQYEGE